jgi:hypothetical protein
MREALARIAAVIAVALAACYDPGAPCGDGYCPALTVCVGDDRCVYPEQLEVCGTSVDDTPCELPNGGGGGVCVGGVCLPTDCGDGRLDPDEECDGTALGDVTTCEDLKEGFHEPRRLSCTASCRYDRIACGPRCGDGIVNALGEACDGGPGDLTCVSAGYYSGRVGCTKDCALDVSACVGECGDGRRTSGEFCDIGDFGPLTCVSYGYYRGTLRCTDECAIDESACQGRCGDGWRDPEEACDDDDLGGVTCREFGAYDGRLHCSDVCTIETSGCSGRCGDGIKNGPEVCDTIDLGGLSCRAYGWHDGDLRCGADCLSIDSSACTGYCGDGIKNGNEQCDGLDHGGNESCTGIGALTGAFGCNAYCQPTTDTCYWGRPRRVATGISGGASRIYALTPDDVWAVFDSGPGLARFDGVRWQTYAMAGATGIWQHGAATFLGTRRQIHLLQGASWIPVFASPFAETSAIWATSLSDVWIAEAGVNGLHHYDGRSWTATPFPTPIAALHGFDGSLWATGDDGAVYWHRDGVWQPVGVPGAVTVDAWRGAGDVLWMARNDDSGQASIYRLDGHTWSRPSLPAGRACGAGWSDRDGTAWLVCEAGSLAEVYAEASDSWRLVARTSESIDHGGPATSGGVWLATSNGVQLVDGPPFETIAPPSTGDLTRLEVTADDHIVAVQGDRLYRREGSGWFDTAITGARSIWMAPDGDLWVGRRRSILRHGRDGTTTYPITGVASSIAGRSSSDVWAVSSGVALHFDGASWSPANVTANPSDVAATSSYLWMVGSDDVVRSDGTGWVSTGLPDGPGLVPTLFAHGDDDVWVTWLYAAALMFDGAAWTELRADARTFSHVWRNSPTDVWARDDDGYVHHFDGTAWSAVDTSALLEVEHLAGAGGAVWIADEAGDIVRLPSSMPAVYGGACAPTLRAYCNASLRGHTATASDGPTACRDGDHAGGEQHYKLEVPVTGRLTATVTSPHDVDLSAVTADERGGCEVDGCVEGQPSDWQVVLDVRQGDTYYLVVGAVDAAAPFTLDVGCEKR